LLNEVGSLFGILKYVCEIVVKKVHVRYLIFWWVLVSVMLHLGYLISLIHLCFITFLSLHVRIHVLLYWSIYLHSCKSV